MLEYRKSAHRKCSFAVNGYKYDRNVNYQCNRASVSLTKYVMSHLIVTRSEKLDWKRLDVLDVCRNSACFLSLLGSKLATSHDNLPVQTEEFFYTESLQEVLAKTTHSPYAGDWHIRYKPLHATGTNLRQLDYDIL